MAQSKSRDCSQAALDAVDTATYIKAILTPEKEQRLNELLEEMHDKTAIDYTKQEVTDIESAVYEMLWKVSERINTRGVFQISRLQACGSMAERVSVWKHMQHGEYCIDDEDAYLEFDYLAMIGQFEDEKGKACPECAEVNVSYPRDYISGADGYLVADLSDMKPQFCKEVIASVDSLFHCVSTNIKYTINQVIDEVSFKHDPNICNGCIVRPTGTLHLNTSIPIMFHPAIQTPAKCSLILQWRSNHGTLCTPNLRFSHTQQVKSLPIFIDFLPAFESQKSQVSPTGHVFNTFVIPKYCNVCSSTIFRCWKKSFCLSEIHTVASEMTDKHRKCYRIIKLFLELMDDTIWYFSYLNQYEVKTMVLHHSRLCTDSSDYCFNCVLSILYEIQRAYETKSLKSFHSTQGFRDLSDKSLVFEEFIAKLCSVSTNDSIDTFVRKIAARYSDDDKE